MTSKYHLIIIGNGVAGVNTAVEFRKKSNESILIISDESELFYSRPALMYIYMGQMREKDTQPYNRDFFSAQAIDLVQARVGNIDVENQVLDTSTGQFYYSKLVLALGSKPKTLSSIDYSKKGISGFYHLSDLERLSKRSALIDNAVVIGGGLIGIELTEMLHSRKKNVTMLVREKNYWNQVISEPESELIELQIQKHDISLIKNQELKSVSYQDDTISSITTSGNVSLSCQFLGISIGVEPNIDLIKNTKIEFKNGILVDNKLQTNIQNIYAVGDCVELNEVDANRRSMEPVWYTAKRMGQALAGLLAGENTPYQQGLWFNSAKFFDLEYQTYGFVPPHSNNSQNEYIYTDKGRLIRLSFDENGVFSGINAWGIRIRQAFFEKMLLENIQKEEMVKNIAKGFFDAEFSKKIKI